MKYYTPELLERCNSSDLDQAYAASQEWEAGIDHYEESLSSWRHRAPEGVRRLLDEFDGHDGLFLGQALLGRDILRLVIEVDQVLWKLSYQLLADPKIASPPRTGNLWSQGPVLAWLYDELTCLSAGRFQHEILRSDGSILRIEFSDVLLICSGKQIPKARTFVAMFSPVKNTRAIARAFRHRPIGVRKSQEQFTTRESHRLFSRALEGQR
jgi:hypothetical protein